MILIIYDVIEDEVKWREIVKRPRTNLKFARREDGTQDFLLPYYLISYNYNYYIGGSNIVL
jgi:hypothetical protein